MNTPNGAADLLTSQDDPPPPPLQLPKVGWDDDEDSNNNNAIHPDPPVHEAPIPPSKSKKDRTNSTQFRSATRSELELQPIPEDTSMHGPWPDFCTYYDYDYDRKKAYRYRMCGRMTMRSGLLLVTCAVLLIAVMVRVGSTSRTDVPIVGGDVSRVKITKEEAQLYESVATSFHPLWFDRSTGWNGTAYLQAGDFCSEQEMRLPCPYVAYCPLGAGYAPSGGVREGLGWAPISDHENSWGEFSIVVRVHDSYIVIFKCFILISIHHL